MGKCLPCFFFKYSMYCADHGLITIWFCITVNISFDKSFVLNMSNVTISEHFHTKMDVTCWHCSIVIPNNWNSYIWTLINYHTLFYECLYWRSDDSFNPEFVTNVEMLKTNQITRKHHIIKLFLGRMFIHDMNIYFGCFEPQGCWINVVVFNISLSIDLEI